MADAYDSSVNNSLAAENASATDKVTASQKAAESQGAAGAKSAKDAGGILGKKQPAVGAPAAPAAPKPAGGLVGAIKNDVQNPAGMIHGGKDLISKDSMKGKELAEDPQANLASKGRSSEYRKVFQSRGAAGKHPWGK
jgi:hypothetical protein